MNLDYDLLLYMEGNILTSQQRKQKSS